MFFFLISSKLYGFESNEKNKYESLEAFSKAIHLINHLYVEDSEVTYDKIITSALEGITEDLDMYTSILSPEEYSSITQETSGITHGFGITLSLQKDQLKVIDITKNSPAEKSGLLINDLVVSINSKNTEKLNKKTLNSLLKDHTKTSIKIKVLRKEKILSFQLNKESIKIPSVIFEHLSPNVMYIKLTDFQENSSFEMEQLIKDHEQNLKALVIDLRGNPGGLFYEAIKLSDLFIESGVIVSTVGRKNTIKERDFANKYGTFSKINIVILINEKSASASEIFAGALKDHKRATLMGQKTYGKGSVQSLLPLPNGYGLKMTIASYHTPKHTDIDKTGIEPNIFLNNKTRKKINSKLRLKSEKWSPKLRHDNWVLYAFQHLEQTDYLH